MASEQWRQKFLQARSSAEARSIPWRLTFDEWLILWGPHMAKVVAGEILHLCRFNDLGEYVAGNVRVDTPKGNASDRQPDSYQRRPATIPWAISLPGRVERLEKGWLKRALEMCAWNQTAASKMLGITYRAMRYKVRKYGIL